MVAEFRRGVSSNSSTDIAKTTPDTLLGELVNIGQLTVQLSFRCEPIVLTWSGFLSLEIPGDRRLLHRLKKNDRDLRLKKD